MPISRENIKKILKTKIFKNNRKEIDSQKLFDAFLVFLENTYNLEDDSVTMGQVNSDWNASSGVAQILNKPSSFPPSFTRLLFKQNTAILHTGVTGETVVAAYLIPGGTFQANDIFKFFLNYSMTNNANAKETRCYINSTPDISGSPIRCGARSNVSTLSSGLGRDIIFRNSITNQNVNNSNQNFQTPENTASGSYQNVNADFSIDQYFVITFNLSVNTDSQTLEYIWAQILR